MRLDQIKAGDLVMLSEGGWHTFYTKHTVARTTKTKIVLQDGSIWNRRGKKPGAGVWSSIYIEPFDAEKYAIALNEKHHRELARKLGEVKWSSFAIETLEQVLSIVNEISTKP